jgi:hypothetical protein
VQERFLPQGYQGDSLKEVIGLACEVMANLAQNFTNGLSTKSMGIANTSFDPVDIDAISCKGV